MKAVGVSANELQIYWARGAAWTPKWGRSRPIGAFGANLRATTARDTLTAAAGSAVAVAVCNACRAVVGGRVALAIASARERRRANIDGGRRIGRNMTRASRTVSRRCLAGSRDPLRAKLAILSARARFGNGEVTIGARRRILASPRRRAGDHIERGEPTHETAGAERARRRIAGRAEGCSEQTRKRHALRRGSVARQRGRARWIRRLPAIGAGQTGRDALLRVRRADEPVGAITAARASRPRRTEFRALARTRRTRLAVGAGDALRVDRAIAANGDRSDEHVRANRAEAMHEEPTARLSHHPETRVDVRRIVVHGALLHRRGNERERPFVGARDEHVATRRSVEVRPLSRAQTLTERRARCRCERGQKLGLSRPIRTRVAEDTRVAPATARRSTRRRRSSGTAAAGARSAGPDDCSATAARRRTTRTAALTRATARTDRRRATARRRDASTA